MTILNLLVQDHNAVKDLLSNIERNKDRELFQQFKIEITAHNKAEEAIFYKPLKVRTDKLGIVIEASHEEHNQTAALIEKISEVNNQEEWWYMFSIIKKSLEAHIAKEETDIFDLAKKHFSSQELQEMENMFKNLKLEFINSN